MSLTTRPVGFDQAVAPDGTTELDIEARKLDLKKAMDEPLDGPLGEKFARLEEQAKQRLNAARAQPGVEAAPFLADAGLDLLEGALDIAGAVLEASATAAGGFGEVAAGVLGATAEIASDCVGLAGGVAEIAGGVLGALAEGIN